MVAAQIMTQVLKIMTVYGWLYANP